jgi:hypothetical protein
MANQLSLDDNNYIKLESVELYIIFLTSTYRTKYRRSTNARSLALEGGFGSCIFEEKTACSESTECSGLVQGNNYLVIFRRQHGNCNRFSKGSRKGPPEHNPADSFVC